MLGQAGGGGEVAAAILRDRILPILPIDWRAARAHPLSDSGRSHDDNDFCRKMPGEPDGSNSPEIFLKK